MKATVQLKFYVTEDEDIAIRRKCAAAGKSVSRAAADALLRYWQPDRTSPAHRRHRASSGRAVGLPGRACLRL